MAPSAGIAVFHSLQEAVKAADSLGIKQSREKLSLLKEIIEPKRDIPKHWLRTSPKSGYIAMLEQPLSELEGIRDAIFKLQEYGLRKTQCREICSAVFRKNASTLGSKQQKNYINAAEANTKLAEYFRRARDFGFSPQEAIRITEPKIFSLVITSFDAEKNIGRFKAKKREILRRFAARRAPHGTPKADILSWMTSPDAMKAQHADLNRLAENLRIHLLRRPHALTTRPKKPRSTQAHRS